MLSLVSAAHLGSPPRQRPLTLVPVVAVVQIINAAPYSLSVNLAVLRLYQLQPSSAKKDLIAKILLKALMQLPHADYKICVQVLPERLQVRTEHINPGPVQDLWAGSGSGCGALALVTPGKSSVELRPA